MQEKWVTQIRDRCLRYEVPFFFKQWGGVNKKRAGRELDGRTWEEMPCNSEIIHTEEETKSLAVAL
jgi:protein gp37